MPIQTKYMPIFLIHANADANAFTNMIPVQSNIDQYKPKYRSISLLAPVNLNFQLCSDV